MAHSWKFLRVGGFDQVSLDSWEDLQHLGELDQKLWGALSVPARGLCIDEQTLALIDSDADGHIRPPELIAAIQWAGERLGNKDLLVQGSASLALADIDAVAHPELLAALRHILAGLGKAEATAISVEDTCSAATRFAAQALNGDGIICPASTEEADLAPLIADLAISHAGPIDASGVAGVDQALLERCRADLEAWRSWHVARLGGLGPTSLDPEQTAQASAALAAVAGKIDDYFTRCRLAAYDPRATELVAASAEQLQQLGQQFLSSTSGDMAALPLARIAAGQPLPLQAGLNPAWQDAIQTFRSALVKPLLGERDSLDEATWQELRAQFTRHAEWLAARPATAFDAHPETWPDSRLEVLADSMDLNRLEHLIAADLTLQPEATAIAAADQITRYVRDLPRLIHNFVAFRDFYSRREPAAFQAGTLYIDGRSCELTLEVLDPARHASLASLSGLYLIYCDCSRGAAKKTIAAALTAGDADQLIVGRNGVFYDRNGQDWDARITRIVDHPISLRQAFWSPYKKVARLVAEQAQKFATARSQNADAMLASKADGIGSHITAPTTPTPAEAGKTEKPTPFDVGRFAGIFAAIGLALGALGTALASVVTGFLGLKFWQIPLALAGILLLISGPAMLLAWFKLRNRSLAPLLDANGWAVNTRARINIPFGTALTQLASLPAGASRLSQDPYAEKQQPLGLYVTLGILLTLAVLYLAGLLPGLGHTP